MQCNADPPLLANVENIPSPSRSTSSWEDDPIASPPPGNACSGWQPGDCQISDEPASGSGQERTCVRGYAWWSVLGLVLVLAAAFKSDPRTLVAIGGLGLIRIPAVLLAVVWAEAGLGCWVLAGLHRCGTRRLLIGCFGIFSLVSLTLALAGSTSCNCFGTVRINPWIMFGADLAILIALCFEPRLAIPSPSMSTHPRRAIAAGTAAIAFSLTLSVRLLQGMPVDVAGSETGRAVAFEPRDWIGRVFPLGQHIDWQGKQPALIEGEWLVVLHRQGCPDCRELLDRLEAGGGTATPQQRIVLLEVPSHSGDAADESKPARSSKRRMTSGHIRNDRDWFVPTPALIELKDGIVSRVPSVSESL